MANNTTKFQLEEDLTPTDNSAYKTREYWDQRYELDKGLYDWFKNYTELKKILDRYIKPEHDILNVGCGNSELSGKMHEEGFHQIYNIDFSPVLIDDMIKKHSSCSDMKWLVMDAMQMDFQDKKFDIVIEKGTIDALMCDQTSAWEVSDDVATSVGRMCSEISRVLKPNGVFISITFAQPHFRKKLIDKQQYNWDLSTETIGDFFHYYVYVMKKKGE
eukprot:TRINITY_DN3323_c0_g1_i1.p1 TRINITY_DN3323_c0_g1~~TRINITY_DN3323_c0_g1_i1.p1  ORF type:complete len:217 (-),score=58.68 TRINITY_DN3323_c0_g1_i1:18-668(-)